VDVEVRLLLVLGERDGGEQEQRDGKQSGHGGTLR
jgi:hypothetical protein